MVDDVKSLAVELSAAELFARQQAAAAAGLPNPEATEDQPAEVGIRIGNSRIDGGTVALEFPFPITRFASSAQHMAQLGCELIKAAQAVSAEPLTLDLGQDAQNG